MIQLKKKWEARKDSNRRVWPSCGNRI